MRKRFALFILLSILTITPSFSENWDDIGGLDNAWENQKGFSNQKYEQVINALEEKKDKKEKKKRKKLFKKISGGGTSLHEELNPNNEIYESDAFKPKDKEEGILLNSPVDIILGDKILERGYYKIIAEKDEKKNIVIKFYQSQFLKGSLIATETSDDYEQKTIDFVELKPFNEHFMKLIFGSLDFNAFAYVQYMSN